MPVENGESVLGSLPTLEGIEKLVRATPQSSIKGLPMTTEQPTPTDRMISLHDALEEFYAKQVADAAREGHRLGGDVDSPTSPLPKAQP